MTLRTLLLLLDTPHPTTCHGADAAAAGLIFNTAVLQVTPGPACGRALRFRARPKPCTPRPRLSALVLLLVRVRSSSSAQLLCWLLDASCCSFRVSDSTTRQLNRLSPQGSAHRAAVWPTWTAQPAESAWRAAASSRRCRGRGHRCCICSSRPCRAVLGRRPEAAAAITAANATKCLMSLMTA